jgi:hypothetical protein
MNFASTRFTAGDGGLVVMARVPPQWLATFRTCAVHAERGMAGCMPQPGGAAPLPGRRYSVDDVEGILYRRIRVFRSDPGIKIWYHKLSLRKDVPSR